MTSSKLKRLKSLPKKANGGWLDSYEDGGDVELPEVTIRPEKSTNEFNKEEVERFQREQSKYKTEKAKWDKGDKLDKMLNDTQAAIKEEALAFGNRGNTPSVGNSGTWMSSYNKYNDVSGEYRDYAEKNFQGLFPANSTWDNRTESRNDFNARTGWTSPKEGYYNSYYPITNPYDKPEAVRAQATMSEEAKPIPVEKGPQITRYTNADYLQSKGLPYGTKHVPGKGRIEVKEDGGWLDSYEDGGETKPWEQPLPTSASIGGQDNTFVDTNVQKQIAADQLARVQANKEMVAKAREEHTKSPTQKNKEAYEKSKAQAKKETTEEFIKEGHKKAVLESPFNVAAAFTPAGATASMMKGIADASLEASQGNYGAAALYGGLEALPFGVGALAKKGVKGVKDIHKINPYAFKPNPEAYYRGLGKTGLDDAIENNVLRTANKTGNYGEDLYMTKDFKIAEGIYSKDQPYGVGDAFDDVDWKMVQPKDSKSYIAEIPESSLTNKNIVNNSNIIINKGPIPTDNVKLYKEDWLRGYKEVPNNVEVGNIDWGKWNPEIPNNKALMAEYNAIEETAKRNGTWMKNPDGTPFKGEPEQFVQQNSKNFKKFYEDSKVTGPNGEPLFMYHGSPNKDIQSFLKPGDKGYSKSPTTTTGESGIYFTDKKDYADKYQNFADTKNLNGRTYQTYLAPKSAITAGETSSAGITEGLSPAFLWNHGPVPVDAVKAGTAMRKLYDNHGYEVAMENPNLIKSAIGNNGMFDITNPNIYKALTGVTAGGTAVAGLKEKKNGGWLDEL